MFVGVDNLSRKIISCYVGVHDKARQIKSIYVGDANGIARLVWQAIKKKVSKKKETVQQTIINDLSRPLETINCVYNDDDNHIIIGGTARNVYDSSLDDLCIYNCYLNEDKSISEYSFNAFGGTMSTSQGIYMKSLCKINDNIGAFLNIFTFTGAYPSGGIELFDWNNSQSISGYSIYDSYTSSVDRYDESLIPLNYNTLLYSYCGKEGYPSGTFFQYKNNELTRLNGMTFYDTDIATTSVDPIMASTAIRFSLSNDRFGVMYTVKNEYSTDVTNETATIVVIIYKYSYDSNGNIVITKLKTNTFPWQFYIEHINSLDDDYFIVSGYHGAFGFHIDSNNNIITTNFICGTNAPATPSRIGKTDSIYRSSGNISCIFYYNKDINTIYLYTSNGGLSGVYTPYKDQEVICPQFILDDLIFNTISFE